MTYSNRIGIEFYNQFNWDEYYKYKYTRTGSRIAEALGYAGYVLDYLIDNHNVTNKEEALEIIKNNTLVNDDYLNDYKKAVGISDQTIYYCFDEYLL